jgi:sulfite reductase (NADPH) flavoprotein alpha-component
MQNAIFIPETAPFNPTQRAWLNGFLAGLFGNGGTISDTQPVLPAKKTEPLLVLYGSQSGNSELLAKRFGKESKEFGYAARVVCMDQWQSFDLASESNLLVVVSTWGDGDLPDNAQAFWKFLSGPGAPRLENLRYSVLALGDTNYASTFCEAGKKIDMRLAELGAICVAPRVDCNVDFESPAKEWAATVWKRFAVKLQSREMAGVPSAKESRDFAPSGGLQEAEAPPSKTTFSRANPFAAQLLTRRALNSAGSSKDTRHIEISIAGSGFDYKPGDALGVMPSNDSSVVSQILSRLKCDGEEEVPAPGGEKTSFGRALLRDYEINKIPFALIEATATKGNATLQSLAGNRGEADKYCHGRDVLDFVNEFDVVIEPAEFAKCLRKLSPRLYSIASSPRVAPESIHLTVAVPQFVSNGRVHYGLCSGFLAHGIKPDENLPVFLQRSHAFALPQNPDAPMIMVGPGTGIAPFRAFLQDREASGAKGRNWLFFGDQHAATDFLYQEELEAFKQRRTLTHLHTAFSRDQEEKIYVQHRMLEHAAELWAWFQEGAYFYVCGDAKRMAKDVDAALHQVAQKAGSLSVEASIEFVDSLRQQKRYQRDVY